MEAGPSRHSWNPITTGESTALDYWLNWRVLLCAICLLSSILSAIILIWKYEGSRTSNTGDEERAETQLQAIEGALYDDECWKPCLKKLLPVWLLAFRVMAFFVLSSLLVVYVIIAGVSTFYYYTQWTFTLVTIYFAIGSLLSIHGCHQSLNQVHIEPLDNHTIQTMNQNANNAFNTMRSQTRPTAGIWGYLFHILYQINAGAVLLTDSVFWLIIVPFLEIKDYRLNVLLIGMHSVNAIFLFGDTILNSLRFQWFRVSYFFLWTAIYCCFQWMLHACISIWWPYPFMDLSSPYAPIGYLIVVLMQVPCYVVFHLILKVKRSLLSKYLHHSYQIQK